MPEGGADVAQIARTVTRLLQPNAWGKRLRLSVNISPHLPPAAADPRTLRRVVLKLVGNAIKFTERGSIEVAVDTIVNDVSGDGETLVRIRVTDTGPGIPAHLVSSIFEPFAKADDSYTRRYNGAGVGLAVAKRLIEMAGGAIGVESEPGSGASFWITVPIIQNVALAQDKITDDVQPPSGLSILALVPETTVHETLEPLLTPFGNRIVFAKSLADAADLTARAPYSLILANAANVDALASTPGQRSPILAIAGADERQPDGADMVLRWPASASALYAAINAVKRTEGPKFGDKTSDAMAAAIDAKAFAHLEKSLGFKTLIDILQSYVSTAEQLAKQLIEASEAKEWTQAGRVAQDFAGAAGGLGLNTLTAASRALAQGARDGGGAGNAYGGFGTCDFRASARQRSAAPPLSGPRLTSSGRKTGNNPGNAFARRPNGAL
jgi:hypothetical protein